ncbi:MAG TPA: hypothetical protein VFA15_08460 [Nitrososphaera sp.]|nr:hypothetical protein [Nitrososphaera sp.]
MSEPVILHWERVIHKNVRSSDMADVGNIISEAGDSFVIMQGAGREYNVPKSCVEGFNGSEVYLGISYADLMKYKIQ